MAFKTIIAPHILLPKEGTDLNAWAVIACDQFTSQLDYWNEVEKIVNDKPSTLRMMLPEAYLGKVDEAQYIKKTNLTIDEYLKNGTLVDQGECFILVDRLTSFNKHRLGLVIAIDLDDYTYQKGVKSLIRASEATIVERIPPRLKIRKDATVELPHILFLFDDKKHSIIEELYTRKEQLDEIYNFTLMKDGGHITGYKIKDTKSIISKFEQLLKENGNGLLFIVGDGNHSLATAKAYWDEIKVNLSEKEKENHPARFALVEAINIYDKGLDFEPIHRVIFNPNDDFVKGLKQILKGDDKTYIFSTSFLKEEISIPKNGPETYKIVQTYIDSYLKNHPETSVDYIHDEAQTIEVAKQNPNSIALIMPALTKGDIFDYIANDEVLPRKAFSMGHANEKRYYLECKKIK